MSKIKWIHGYELIDSRGFPTVACKVFLEDGTVARAIVPSGASTGEREALELRDGDETRFMGKGVLKAVDNLNNKIAPALIGLDSTDQHFIDKTMIDLDGTDTKSNLGANSILAVSMAVARAAAASVRMPLYAYISNNIAKEQRNEYVLPLPMLNVINGGEHADNTIDFQEFMFMPVGAKSLKESVRIASECFHKLLKILKSHGYNTAKGDEGGFAPDLKDADEALSLMVQAITEAGYKPGKDKDVAIALDPACSELYNSEEKIYRFKKAIKANILSVEEGTKTTDQMIAYWDDLSSKYPIVSIEDGLAEQDWEGFIAQTSTLGSKIQIVGDDLYCTNPKIVQEGIERKATNSVLIKLNQIGTVTETIQTIQAAHKAGWTAVVSHRSGETEDTFIADLAVGLSTGQIKTGSMSRSERIAKYNRLIEIEEELGNKAIFHGLKSFKVNI